MADTWKTWDLLFDHMITSKKSVCLKACTIETVRKEWNKFKLLDVIKVSKYDLQLLQREDGACEICLKCSCCDKLV